jgi:hypothetical protein
MIKRSWVLGAALGILLLPLHVVGAEDAVLSDPEVTLAIVIEDLQVANGTVSGTVVNNSDAIIRGVGLLLRQTWHWTDERHPGPDSPGRSTPFTLTEDVPPHGRTPFRFETPALGERPGGRFVTTMDVTGFTEVGR